MHTEHPDVPFYTFWWSLFRHLFFFSARDPFLPANAKKCLSRAWCERILALSRVLFSSFGPPPPVRRRRRERNDGTIPRRRRRKITREREQGCARTHAPQTRRERCSKTSFVWRRSVFVLHFQRKEERKKGVSSWKRRRDGDRKRLHQNV